MTDFPMLCTASAVLAMLAGRKTQNRWPAWRSNGKPSPWQKVKVGDRLWVREAWRTLHKVDCLSPRHLPDDISKITYEADPENRNPLWAFGGKMRPSIHMPRWASRVTLVVTEVRRQRLQDISEEDARAEGALEMVMGDDGDFYESDCGTHRCGFAGLWEHLYGDWDANPEVVAMTFEAHRCNIDQMSKGEAA